MKGSQKIKTYFTGGDPMKRYIAALSLCVLLAAAGCSSCSEKNDGKSGSGGSSATVAETTAATDPSEAADVEPGLTDDALVGMWYNEMRGGSYNFRSDGKVDLYSDYSSTIHFSEDEAVINENSIPYEYDGKTLTITADSEELGDESEDENSEGTGTYEVVSLERTGGGDTGSVDGKYIIKGGEVYNTYRPVYDYYGLEPELYMEIKGEKTTLILGMCEYSADGERMKLFGGGAELFGPEDKGSPVMSYEIDEDILTVTYESGSKDKFTKVTDET